MFSQLSFALLFNFRYFLTSYELIWRNCKDSSVYDPTMCNTNPSELFRLMSQNFPCPAVLLGYIEVTYLVVTFATNTDNSSFNIKPKIYVEKNQRRMYLSKNKAKIKNNVDSS